MTKSGDAVEGHRALTQHFSCAELEELTRAKRIALTGTGSFGQPGVVGGN